jgi:hypothetical protein
MPSDAPFNRFASIPMSARAILRAIGNFKICARGRLRDLKPFGSFIFCMKTFVERRKNEVVQNSFLSSA